MLSWIFNNEEYLNQYHKCLEELTVLYDEELKNEIIKTRNMIASHVQSDVNPFCTFEEFEKGAETLIEYCNLRNESVKKQLSGEIPSTSEGQAENSSNFVDASHININDMGKM